MPGIVVDGINEEAVVNEMDGPIKENAMSNKSPRSTLSPQSPCSAALDHPAGTVPVGEVVVDESSDLSPSRHSFRSEGEESRIDSELGHLVGGEMREVEIMEEEEVDKPEHDTHSISSSTKAGSSGSKKSGKLDRNQSASTKSISSNTSKKGLDNPDLGRFLLKQARDLISSGDNPQKALELALRATKSFEICANGKPSLELVMSLHVVAAIYCSIGQYNEAIPVLEHSIEIPVIEEGQEHALAKFAGHMQLGDTYAMLGQLENSTKSYTTGLKVQKQVLGETDPRVGETCRYLAEAHVQALQFDEAQRLCKMALDIHSENGTPASLEEAAGRRLMGLICETKGDHEAALEHLVLASMAMVANGQEAEVASVDCSIGDTYLSLSRYDEAAFAYQKALTAFKTAKGENHPAVASVFVRLADLYNKTGKLKESKSYCENALRIYEKPMPGIPPEEIATGLTDRYSISEAAELFEEAKIILEQECGPYHPDTLGVYSNLAGTYDAMGRLDDAIEILEHVVGMREEKLGTANPDVDDEKKRLAELLKEAGRVRSRKAKSLENLLDSNSPSINKDDLTVL
ncbi:hypothetical protein GH714_022718 [Hevea brasiliensis]|uniref:MalT-like TPR region domain-containing protein n=1 Tax=Hevea brasiliensis TaxID=3981 RepID=A0A6A6MFY6_HEVBR|nr:hypothetical protein GH714_022718 [Hevea brasiliensis]